MKMRLQKIIALAGLASRRQAEIWITDGEVAVNGKVESRLGALADPEKDAVMDRVREEQKEALADETADLPPDPDTEELK